MHRLSANFVLGYHGCDQSVADAVLRGGQFRKSDNDYDWLGPGIYFWEANPRRGLDFAHESMARKGSSITEPAVVGAIIDLGLCFDLASLGAVERLRSAFEGLKRTMDMAGIALPENHSDLKRRNLDCAVMRRVHSMLADEGVRLDTVRGIFVEGDPIYPTSGFNTKTHTQIAVCNPDCIKGVFRVPSAQLAN